MQDRSQLNIEVSIDVGSMKWSGNLKEVTMINPMKLAWEMHTQPGLVSWFGQLEVEAKDIVIQLKNRLAQLDEEDKVIHAELDLKFRYGKDEEGRPLPDSVRITDKFVEASVLNSLRYRAHLKKKQDVREELRIAMKKQGVITKILIALDHKKDMLVQSSANTRKEVRAGGYEDPPTPEEVEAP